MLPTLFYIPAHLAGLPMFGFGLLLTLWAVFCVGFMGWLVWRQGFNAETWSYVPIFVVVAAVIVWLLPAIGKPEGLPVRGYGVMVLIAVLSGTTLATYRARKVGVSPDLIYTAIFWIVVPGIVGARLFYVLQYWSVAYQSIYEQFGLRAAAWAAVNISDGGLVVFGSFFGGMLGLTLFVYKYRVPLLPLLDLLAPSMMLGVALGRVGCLFTGCCFGDLCHHGPALEFPFDSPAYESQAELGQFYGFAITTNENSATTILSVEKNSIADRAGLEVGKRVARVNGFAVPMAGPAHGLLRDALFNKEPVKIELADGKSAEFKAFDKLPAKSLPVYPAQIYSTIDAALICLLLLAYAPFRRRDGELFALMLTIYPISRFLIEILRNDEAPIRGTGMTISQNVSLLMLVAIAGLWYYLSKQPKGYVFGKSGEQTFLSVR